MGIIYIIGTVQAFFIEFMLLNKKNKTLPDKILAIWMFFFGYHLFSYYLIFSEIHAEFPMILGVHAPIALIHGPFLLLYVQSLIGKKQTFERINLLHFITPLSYYVFLSPIFFLPEDEILKFVFEQLPTNPPLYIEIYSVLTDLSGVTYVIWSLLILKRHQKNIGDNFSFTEEVNLKWLRNIILGMAVLWFTVVATSIMTDDNLGSSIVFGVAVVFIFLIGYKGSRQGIIFTDEFQKTIPKEPLTKYQKSSLTSDQAKEYLDRLAQYVKQEKPYIESRLTLPQLAGQLEMNHNYLSQVINDKLNQNFYDFINGHRIAEFKERLSNDTSNRYTFLAHAHESGFSSKSSFNEVFKKIEGKTPSQYLKTNLNSITHVIPDVA